MRVELWQVDKSAAAPKFVVVSQPNNWAKAAKHSTEGGGPATELKLRQLEFWEKFREYGMAQETGFGFRKAAPHYWYDIGTGSGNWWISLTINTQSKEMGCGIYVP